MKILGKIIIISLSINLFAVQVSVENTNIVQGESVVFTISSNSNDTVFPEISDINGYLVESQGTSSSTTILNNKINTKLSKSFSFTPTKNVVIPSYMVIVNGKKETTNKIPIKVSKIKATNNPKYQFSISTNKKDVYVNEPIILTILFKRNKFEKIAKINIQPPNFDHFIIKDSGSRQYKQNDNVIEELKFVLFPQEVGKLSVNPFTLHIGKINKSQNVFSMFGNSVKWKNIYSNKIDLNVKALPNNVDLYGDFSINASIDKNTVNVNEPVNLSLKITGQGNMENLDSFKIDVNNAVVYADKSSLKTDIKNNTYKGTFLQKFAIVGDQNFTIPSIKLSYFSSKLKKIVTKKTEKFNIHVKNDKLPSPSIINTQNISNKKLQKEIWYKKYIYILIGIFIGILASIILIYTRRILNKRSKTQTLAQKIKSAKSDKNLLKILISSKLKNEFQEQTKQLEENIYNNQKYKIDKKKIISIISTQES